MVDTRGRDENFAEYARLYLRVRGTEHAGRMRTLLNNAHDGESLAGVAGAYGHETLLVWRG